MFNLPRNISAGEGVDWNVVIIDATEIPIQRPKKQSSCYSGKKKAHTFKVQAIIHSRTQQILCMSKGAVHNFELFKYNFYVVPKTHLFLEIKVIKVFMRYMLIACYQARLKSVVD